MWDPCKVWFDAYVNLTFEPHLLFASEDEKMVWNIA